MKQNRISTKIIAGKYKGKLLDLPSLDTTRSSKAILKESLFNVLQFDIYDKIFIESFAGSGSIGLEAISRGAKSGYFIELSKSSYKILTKNCKAIDSNSCQTFLGDTFIQSPLIINSLKNCTNELIIYIDPPFDYRKKMQDIYKKCFKMIKNIENDNIFLVVVEHVSSLDMPQTLGKFHINKTKKFGKSFLTYYGYK